LESFHQHSHPSQSALRFWLLAAAVVAVNLSNAVAAVVQAVSEQRH
jgi:hypothetical protein